MTSSERPTVRITGPTDLLALIPFVIGFQPEASLVLLAMHDETGLLIAARVDLPTTAGTVEQLHIAVDQMAARTKPHAGGYVVLVGYGPAELVEPAVRTATDRLRHAGVPVREALRMAESRFWRLGCHDPACCPPEGTVFDPADSPVTATAVYAGMVALPDRAALAATLAPVTGPARTSMVAATLAACAFLTQLLDAAAPDAGNHPDTALDTPVGRAMQIAGRAYLSQAQDGYRMLQPIDDERAAMLTVLLDLPGMREFAARQTSPEEWQIQMWSDLVRRAETAFTATPATLLALSAMQAGHGTLASIAIGRALACEPDNRLAQLLAQAIAAGIDPATVTAMLAG